MLSVGNLVHRAIVFSCMGFGIYGTVVIGQNMVVKKRAIAAEREQLLAQQVADEAAWHAAHPEAAKAE